MDLARFKEVFTGNFSKFSVEELQDCLIEYMIQTGLLKREDLEEDKE